MTWNTAKWTPTIGPERVVRDPISTLMPITEAERALLEADVLYLADRQEYLTLLERAALRRVAKIVGVEL